MNYGLLISGNVKHWHGISEFVYVLMLYGFLNWNVDMLYVQNSRK
jgi:hypothetical protein